MIRWQTGGNSFKPIALRRNLKAKLIRIGHFRITFSLFLKASLSAKSFMGDKFDFHGNERKVEEYFHVSAFALRILLTRGKSQLGNSLLELLLTLKCKLLKCRKIAEMMYLSIVYLCVRLLEE